MVLKHERVYGIAQVLVKSASSERHAKRFGALDCICMEDGLATMYRDGQPDPEFAQTRPSRNPDPIINPHPCIHLSFSSPAVVPSRSDAFGLLGTTYYLRVDLILVT